MKFEYIVPFVEATKNVLSTMGQVTVESEAPFTKADRTTSGDISGIIGMSGENINGNMIVSFDEPSILTIASNMLMAKFTELDDEITDLVGELTNMICGGAKNALHDLGVQIAMAIPMMVKGRGIEMSQLTQAPTMVIPFRAGGGRLTVEANLHPK